MELTKENVFIKNNDQKKFYSIKTDEIVSIANTLYM